MTTLRNALDRSEDRPAAVAQQPDIELFCFRIRQARFAFASGLVTEVVRLPPVTSLPGSPPFLLGVAAHRGEVIPVVDLTRFFGMGSATVTARTRTALCRAEGMVVLFVADQLEGLNVFAASSVVPPPLGGEGPAEFVTGIISDREGTLSIVDLPRLLSTARARTLGR